MQSCIQQFPSTEQWNSADQTGGISTDRRYYRKRARRGREPKRESEREGGGGTAARERVTAERERERWGSKKKNKAIAARESEGATR